ncbi:MAG: nucleoside phosphorylase, partial [Cyclobacteriaceae bacterium]|nr:nucleoside phosphorylase [Cyclobacteriaceae bacterium]
MPETTIRETDLMLNDDGSVYHLNLLPRHISDTIITVEDPSRVNQIAEFFDTIEYEINKREFVTITGFYKKKRISVISTGIGPDNMEIFFNEIDALVNIDLKNRTIKSRRKKLNVIRIGSSSAIQNDIPLEKFIVSNFAIGLDNVIKYYFLKSSEFEQQIANYLIDEIDLPDMPYVVEASSKLQPIFKDGFIQGNTLTTPGFYAAQGRQVRIPIKYPKLIDQLMCFHKNDFWISNLEMETATFYAFARIMGHHAINISAVTDNFVKSKTVK